MDESLVQLINHTGAGRFRDQLSRLALRSIRIQSQVGAITQVCGISRLGGLPDLPDGVEWPCMDITETPLVFLAQINLAETAPHDVDRLLPTHGMLYFFADAEEPFGFGPSDTDRWRVLYSETVPATGPTPAPDGLAGAGLLKESALTFAAEWTLPPYESPMVEGLNLTEAETDQYLEGDGEGVIHRLLGHPQQIQGYVPYEVAMASQGLFSASWESVEARAVRAQHSEWTLLLQVDSDWESNGMMWGDVGRLYFYIKTEDLKERCFDQVWLMMQCS